MHLSGSFRISHREIIVVADGTPTTFSVEENFFPSSKLFYLSKHMKIVEGRWKELRFFFYHLQL